MAKVPKAVLSFCMTQVHKKCGSPKKAKTCASNFLKDCIRNRRTGKSKKKR